MRSNSVLAFAVSSRAFAETLASGIACGSCKAVPQRETWTQSSNPFAPDSLTAFGKKIVNCNPGRETLYAWTRGFIFNWTQITKLPNVS